MVGVTLETTKSVGAFISILEETNKIQDLLNNHWDALARARP